MSSTERTAGLRVRLVTSALALAGCLSFAGQVRADTPDVVSEWNATAEQIIAAKGVTPGIYFALVHLAVYDAVVAIDRRYTPYATIPAADTAGASTEAAAAAAAHAVLRTLFPDQSTVLDAALQTSLGRVPDGPSETKGVAVGQEVAARMLELRASDGRSNLPGTYVFRSGPGEYQATPPAFLNPILPAQVNVQPFAIESGMQFRAYGPPDVTSARYAEEFDEVRRLGSATSAERTPEQTEVARFYFEGPATFWTRNYRTFITGQYLSTTEAARLYAMLLTSYADASIACWDSKYHFNFWRPVTAIHNADADGNPATAADASWLPLGFTPPHPEYPSAHACMTSAMHEALRAYFSTRHLPMTLTSTIPGVAPRHFDDLQEQMKEVIDARVWGGFHFRSANTAGAELGRDVGRYVVRNYFRPVRKKNH